MQVNQRKPIYRRGSKSFRVLKEFDNHEMLIGMTDTDTKLRGYIAIHNTNLGPALGGTRLQTYASEEAAMRDVLNLSKAMSYKCALAGLPWGGGKAVIIDDPSAKREDMLHSYAAMVENLGGLFKTGTDVGIYDNDVVKMSKHTQHMLGVSAADRGDLTTAKCAALGVYYSIRAALAHVYDNDSPKGHTIGIKGLGKLGGELARMLYADGADIIAADIDDKTVKKFQKELPGIKIVPSTEIHKLALDVYSPCALGNELTRKTIKELQCRIIAGGANNQLLDDKSGDVLFAKGILYTPDYITNAGGLIYVADELEADGFHKRRVEQRIKEISQTLEEVFTRSEKAKVAPHRVANEIGRQRIDQGVKTRGH